MFNQFRNFWNMEGWDASLQACALQASSSQSPRVPHRRVLGLQDACYESVGHI